MSITSEQLVNSIKVLGDLAFAEGIMNASVADILTQNLSESEMLEAIPIEVLDNVSRAHRAAYELLGSVVGSVIQQIPVSLLVIYNNCHTAFELISNNSASEEDFLQNLPIDICEKMSDVQTVIKEYGVTF
jgi:hypothetical protein